MTDHSSSSAALAHFCEGYSCSQSVFAAFAQELGLPPEVGLRLAAPFGGGIGRRGEVCGAATGGLLALGLRYGSIVPGSEGKEQMYAIAAEFIRRFRVRTGALHCRDLIQADMSTPEGLAAARERDVFRVICPDLVAAAAEIASEMLDS